MPSLISADQTLIDQQIRSERESDFDSNSAYGEVLDNSIQANAKNIKIKFLTLTKSKKEILEKIVFGDDGDGMSSGTVENCLTQGFSTRYNDREGIGRFGVGMTKAFMNQCLVCEIYSKEKNEDWYYSKVDISPENKNKNEISSAVKKDPPKDFDKLSGKNSGTIIVWSKHDKQDGSTDNLIEDFKIWCGRTYRKFIFNDLKIKINEEEVKSIDPTFLNTKTSKFPDDEKGTIVLKDKISWPVDPDKRSTNNDTHDILITVTLAPTRLREGRGDGSIPDSPKFKKIQDERNIDEDWNGISILRNDREVFFGYPHPWTRAINFNQPRGRWVGFEIRFNAVHDKSFVVKNIKRGAKPILSLKTAISDVTKNVFRNACQKVTEQWDKYEADLIIKNKKAGISTGHEEAERIAKGQAGTKDKLTQNKDGKELHKNALTILDEKEKQILAAWEAKIKSHPYVIYPSEWKGPEFVQLAYTKDGAVLKYNLSHPYHREMLSIEKALETEQDPEKLKASAKKLKTLNDLLLMTYCRAEKQKNEEIDVTNTEDFLEDLRNDWGLYLKRYLRDSNK